MQLGTRYNYTYTRYGEPLAEEQTLGTRHILTRHYDSYGRDFNKNVTELFDEAGKLAATYDYTPYGELLKQPSEGIGKDNPFRYSSEYHDEELGLIYCNYRHYNPNNVADCIINGATASASKGGYCESYSEAKDLAIKIHYYG